MRIALALTCLTLPTLAGCAFFSPAAPHQPVHFSEAPSPDGAERFPHWPLPPFTDLEHLRLFETTPFEVRALDTSVGGTSGAYKANIAFPSLGADVKFKVKRIPRDLDGVNNAPRKELAAYVIQRLFLDPEDYVVPSTLVYCAPLEIWERNHPATEPTLGGTNCVLLAVSLWLKNVTLPDPLYDEQRFLTDPTYAYFLSNFNVFTYVIGHKDGREGNFLVSKDDARRQVFAIDNGSSFNPLGYNYFVPNWNVLRVAAVRKKTINRLRKLERGDLDFLEVAAQIEIGSDGAAHVVAPGESLDDDKGALREGNTVQFGLTEGEIDHVWERIERLIEDVDDGKVPVF